MLWRHGRSDHVHPAAGITPVRHPSAGPGTAHTGRH
ncbi:hypothetical protein J3A72_002241 [Stenotrophomonas sp. PvP093]|nr:hypothetical protein [Stenotrophomonas sp. PvP093]